MHWGRKNEWKTPAETLVYRPCPHWPIVRVHVSWVSHTLYVKALHNVCTSFQCDSLTVWFDSVAHVCIWVIWLLLSFTERLLNLWLMSEVHILDRGSLFHQQYAVNWGLYLYQCSLNIRICYITASAWLVFYKAFLQKTENNRKKVGGNYSIMLP